MYIEKQSRLRVKTMLAVKQFILDLTWVGAFRNSKSGILKLEEPIIRYVFIGSTVLLKWHQFEFLFSSYNYSRMCVRFLK